jgi:hypothetical protein
MLEPGGRVFRSSSARVAPYTYQALPESSVANARLTGCWAGAGDAHVTISSAAAQHLANRIMGLASRVKRHSLAVHLDLRYARLFNARR